MSNAIRRIENKKKKQIEAVKENEKQSKVKSQIMMLHETILMSGAVIAMVFYILALVTSIFWLKITLFTAGCLVAIPYIKNRFFGKKR